MQHDGSRQRAVVTSDERMRWLERGDLSRIARRLRPPVHRGSVSQVVRGVRRSARIERAAAALIAGRAKIDPTEVFAS